MRGLLVTPTLVSSFCLVFLITFKRFQLGFLGSACVFPKRVAERLLHFGSAYEALFRSMCAPQSDFVSVCV